MKLDTPSGSAVDDGGDFYPAWVAFFTRVKDTIVGRSQAATTLQRPTKNLEVGLPFFDTTLGKPIWLKTVVPAVWVDATGAVV